MNLVETARKMASGNASAITVHVPRLLWWLNTGLGLMLFVAGLAAQYRHGFWLMPNLPEAGTTPILANVLAGTHSASGADFYPFVLAGAFAQAAAFTALGLLLFQRKSGDPMGIIASWLLIAIGLGFTPTIVFLPLWAPAWHLLVTIFQAGLFVMAFLFLCLFPNGRFFPSWSRYVVLAWLAYALLWPFFPQLNPHRTTVIWPVIAFAAVITLGIIFQLFRYRRLSDPTEKRGVKWVMVGFSIANSALIAIALLIVSHSSPLDVAAIILLSLAPTLIPITIAIAIQRQNLWDVGSLVRKTLIYALLTILLAGVYYASVIVLQNLLSTITGRNEPIAIILSTLLIAALFQPVRERLQRGVNRLLYGERDDPYAVLSKLSRQLRETPMLGQTLPTITTTITRTLKLPYAAIELMADDGEEHIVAASGRAIKGTEEWPLLFQGEIVGRLRVSARSPGEMFTPIERQLLADIATQAGAAAYSARLMSALQQSRERLVLAREEERRRIRRDLHDELGPALASQTFSLDAAIDLLEADPTSAAVMLQTLKSRNQELVGDIRRLVYELRPPALDNLGLLGALQANLTQITTPTITVSAIPDPLPALPAAVEVAAYRIALEGVNNTVRHAGALSCAVTLEIVDSHLILTIIDDGAGLSADGPKGIGLRSMGERAEEVGGVLTLSNLFGGGTRVTAVLPL